MITLRLDPAIEKRLNALAKKTGRTKSYYLREAIMEHLEDMEDRYMAEEVLSRNEKTYTLEEVKKRLGLDD